MVSKQVINVKILMIGRHFLYLPVYLAQFDLPQMGKLPFYGKIPSNFHVEAVLPPRNCDRTDEDVFKILMDARLPSSDIMFAVCDPTVLLSNPDKNAVMAASIISSSAFWAVNHKAKDVKLVSDLASFDQIICYGEKTTSNLIARRIVKRDTNKLVVVNSTDEIEKLESLGEGALAISPELLKIANLLHGPLGPKDKRAEIVLELSTTKEFSNVLTTALFTRLDVVDKYPELVSGLLTALQCSLLAIHAKHPIVVQCAKHNYIDAFYVEEALTIASKGKVFPDTIELRRDGWQRACEFYYISHAVANGREKSALTMAEERQAEVVYTQAYPNDVRKMVSDAITFGFKVLVQFDNNKVSRSQVSTMAKQMLVYMFFLIVGFAAANVLSAAVTLGARIAIALSWIAMVGGGWKSGEIVGYPKPSGRYAVHWGLFVLVWWSLHELVVEQIESKAHFLSGLRLGAGLAGGLLSIAGGVLITMGFQYMKVKRPIEERES